MTFILLKKHSTYGTNQSITFCYFLSKSHIGQSTSQTGQVLISLGNSVKNCVLDFTFENKKKISNQKC